MNFTTPAWIFPAAGSAARMWDYFTRPGPGWGPGRKAIESIGLDYETIRQARDWSEDAVIGRLRELHKAGVDLRTGAIQKTDIPLSGAVQRYFGTMRRALEAAGLPYPDDRSRAVGHWTEALVLNEILDLHARGVDLRYTAVKQGRQSLFWAAKHFFGSYVNAVREAGINYWEMSQLHLTRARAVKTRAEDE